MEGRTRRISRTGGGALKFVLALTLALGMSPALPVALADEGQGVQASGSIASVREATVLPAAVNGVITLTEDTTVPELGISASTVIDLDGHTLTYTGGDTVVLAGGNNLELRNGTFKALDIEGANNDDYAKGVFNIQKGTSITLDDVVFMTNGAALFPTGDAASVNVSNSEIYAPVYCVGTNAGTADNYGVVITLTGSTFMTAIVESTKAQLPEGDSCPVMINVPGTLLMDECQVVGTRQAVVVRGGSAKITRSEIMIVPTVGVVPEEMIGCNLYTNNDPYANGEIWKSGNEVPFGAVVLGNNSDAYKYPAAVDLEETIIFVSEESRDRFPAVYAYDIKEKGREVSFIKAGGGIGGDIKSPVGHEVDTNATGVAEVNGVGFSSLEAAISAANPGDTVELIADHAASTTVSIDKGIILTAAEGVEVKVPNGVTAFKISNGAAIENVVFDMELGDGETSPTTAISMGSYSSVSECTFNGNFVSDNGQTTRGIISDSGATDIYVTNNAFKNIRQPGYINSCTATISGNTVGGTKGWVVDSAANVSFNGNKFSDNAVDIAIIANTGSGSTDVNAFSKKTAYLSEQNNGAYVQNQVSKVEAKGGNLVVGNGGVDYTLEKALADAQNGDTIMLEAGIETGRFTIPDGVTVDGDGHEIKDVSAEDPGTFVLMGNDSKLENAILNIDGKDKHGVQFYCTEGGTLSGVTVNGGTFTSVIVNGATGVTIEDCVLNPDGYANIEYAMGTNVTTVPRLTVENVDFADDAYQIWADEKTTGKIAMSIGGDPTQQQIRQEIISNITNRNEDPITLTTRFDSEDNTPVSGTIESEVDQPSKPVTPSKPSFDVTVDQPANGAVTVSPKSAKEGDKVTITLTPDLGYELAQLTVADEDGDALELTENADGTYSFTMPAG
ncbi:hypothetical protein QUW41_10185, partial [Slackia piriformis]|nr:hypothetical protein [Slackia piriformis]